ncbi:double-strand break repair protein AddB [Phyllobacterium sp. 21LDTY02-6]|uniref:double-strand break repair protein AddB n=1 Tax=Phyllobacterium sp. 21LDTY02-6 TaxID=2944903 RepID=UPI002020453E|nr:double-strand break repair protein AddB [Phyllobacterium sp. 21LDTY02-6]MCO4317291.1 double-strand break repair protein AddB [Phyllobacterium sp. 21LDTY02-6]
MADARSARIFSISPGTPFLPTLVEALRTGMLVPSYPAAPDDPMALADATIYVPTRRAARTLRSLLVEKSPVNSAILPTIRPLGDVDEDAAMFDTGSDALFDLLPPIGGVERLLLLARLVRPWRERLPDHVRALFGNEEIAIPATTADALWLARDLATLMDQVETEGTDWASLGNIAAAELPNWWQVTLDFLNIVTSLWPDILAERRRSNPAAHRNRLIELEAERLLRNQSGGPVIAAGSTGSIPATAKLLAVIASLPQGAVVLPGLDRDMDDPSWDLLANPGSEPSIFGHPQFGLHKLLKELGVLRRDVMVLGEVAAPKRRREMLMAEAMRPADTTEKWAELARGDDIDPATSGISLVEAANEREEAMAVALALRHAIEEPGRTAALVTADRDLARRVSAELARFNISADDSGGRALRETPPATLMRLVLDCVFTPGDPVGLLALLKHPLTRLGLSRADVASATQTIELIALRGGTGRVTLSDLATFFDERLAASGQAVFEPFWLKQITAGHIEAAREACRALSQCLEPLVAIAGAEGSLDLSDFMRATVTSLESLASDETRNVATLYAGTDGEQFASFLRNLVSAESGLDAQPAEFPAMMEALLAGEVVKPRAGAHPRLFIWGALEARLQTVDTVIIGGLNEGTWPGKTRNDPFMSRPMKSIISLEPPERRTGLAAHDFQMALGMDRVILTRAQRAANSPTVPSRWLQRLETVLGKKAADALRGRGATYLDWAREFDHAPDEDFVKRPEPKPPLEARPTHFSVTEIETLRRDPYAIFAKRVLRLRPIDPLIRDPDAAERGSLFHDVLASFTQSGIDPARPDAAAELLQIGRRYFDALALPEEIDAVWWPRFHMLVPQFLQWERDRAGLVAQRHAEVSSGKIAIDGTGVTLSGRADRLDLLRDGTVEIIDYKTGSTPSRRQAHVLLSPQLALEAALLARGAFKELGQRNASELLYVRLRPSGRVEPESVLRIGSGGKASEKPAPELAALAWLRLTELLTAYRDPDKGYLSRALPFKESDLTGDYDHLARVLEWSAGGADDSGEGE